MAFTPTYDYTHAINGLKGWPNWSPLDFAPAAMAANDAPYAVEGRCVHLDPTTSLPPTGTASTGSLSVPAGGLGSLMLGAAGQQMPMFLHRSQSNYDVANSGGSTAGMAQFGWVAGIPTGNIGALVATGAFELETTEFDSATAAYTANAYLKSPTFNQISAGVGQANAGLLYTARNWAGGSGNVTYGTDTICGMVSRGNYTNNYKVPVLAFWPVVFIGSESTLT